MSGDVALPGPAFVAGLAELSRDELVDLGRRVASVSRWVLGDLAGQVQTAYGEGDLARYAEEIGVEYATLKAYKAVAKAYPAEKVMRITHSWSVYQAFASLPEKDRLELVTRQEPWTFREARDQLAERRKPKPVTAKPSVSADHPPNSSSGAEDSKKPVPNGPKATVKPLASEAEPGKSDRNGPEPPAAAGQETGQQVADSMTAVPECPGCAPLVAQLRAELEKARAEIERLGKIRPDVVMAAELEAVSADRDRLAALLAARRSAAPVAAEQAAPPTAPQPEPEASDSAHGNGQAPSEPRAPRGARTTCGAAGTAKFCFVAAGRLVSIAMPPDGRQAGELWLCGEHQEEMTERLGAEVDLDPAGDGGYDFDEPCQFPVRAGVLA